MKHLTLFGKSVVVAVALAVATSATSTGDDDSADDSADPPATTRAVVVTVVNNTSTPEAGPNHPEGYLRVSCTKGIARPSRRNSRVPLTCLAEGDQPVDNLWYQARLADDADTGERRFHNVTMEVDCQTRATVTLTGSGESITAQPACNDPATG